MSIISKYSLPSPGSLHWDSIHDSWPQSVSGGHVSAVARDHMWWLGPGQYTCSACCHISPPATCAAFFLCVSACFTILSSLMNPFPHTSQLNGFSPVWRHMWRRRSVLWLNCFGQTSHLYGLSPACLAKCSWNIQNWISDFTIFYIITIYSIFQFLSSTKVVWINQILPVISTSALATVRIWEILFQWKEDFQHLIKIAPGYSSRKLHIFKKHYSNFYYSIN